MPVIENTIEAATEKLEQADRATRTIEDAGRSIGALIIACQCLVDIVQEQQEKIEKLEDILQDHLERRRR